MTDSRARNYLYLLLLSGLCITTISLPLVKRKKSRGELGEFFEGDILIDRQTNNNDHDQSRVARDTMMMVQDMPLEGSGLQEIVNMDKVGGNLWPDNTVFFKIDPDLNDYLRSFFTEAMNAWKAETCLNFKQLDLNDQTHQAYLNFTDKMSCSSYVGRIGRMQEVSITMDCDRFGHAAHEIGHAIGLAHEHTRSDRDQYIQIFWENIDDRYENNFRLYPHHHATQDIEYDFQSIMHYPLDAFADNRKLNTIVIRDAVKPLPSCIKKIGQRGSLSFKDKLRVCKMYNCTENIATLEAKGDDCPLTPRPSTPAPTTPTPKPKPSCKKSVITDEEITLSLTDGLGKDNVICSSYSCLRKKCSVDNHWKGDCHRAKVFQIHQTRNKKTNLIKSGETIALRSIYRDQWMDCSRKDGCRLTNCDDTPASGKITNYTNQICSVHHLKIVAIGKRKNQRIQTSDGFHITSVDGSLVLNCNGPVCKLVKEGSNDCSLNNDESSGSSSGSECTKTIFRIEKDIQTCNRN